MYGGRPWLALVAALVAACAPQPSPPPSAEPAAPAVLLGSATTQPPASVAATTVLPPKALPYTPCAPVMFDHEVGHHGLTAFEDQAGLLGYRRADGSVAIAPRFRFAYPFSPQGVAAVFEDAGPGFIDVTGKLLARAFLYDNGPDYFTEERARIIADGKVGFIDQRGRIVVEPRYGYASAFCHGRAAVCVDCQLRPGPHGDVEGGPWGFIDRQGRLVVPLIFDEVKPFEDDRAEVRLHGKPVLIDRAGKVVGSPEPR